MNIVEVSLKLILAVALGGLIGIERESSYKTAGFRINILICVSATMMMILAGLIFENKEGPSGDVIRMAAGVITGIGLIGAGSIIQARGMIVGLTTAATLWTVAVLGLVIGSGYYLISLIYTVIIILTLITFRHFEGRRLTKSHFHYQLKSKYSRETLSQLKKMALHEGIKFREISQKKEGNFSVISFSFPASEEKEQKFNHSLSNLEEILEIKIE
jgi:putative Mg2+ transporter-C (MgtC) family protein